MPKRDPRDLNLIADLNLLLDALREEWEFVGGVRGADLIEGSKPLTSKRFTDTVLAREPEIHGNRASWERRVKRRFVQRYGHEVSTRTYRI